MFDSIRRFALNSLGAAILFSGLTAFAQTPVAFDDYFTNAAIRLEMYQIGDASNEVVTLQRIYQEPVWPESPRSLSAEIRLRSLRDESLRRCVRQADLRARIRLNVCRIQDDETGARRT